MNTLSANSLYNLLKNWTSEKEILSNLFSENLSYPINISGIQGSLYSFFIKSYSEAKKGKLIQDLSYSQSGYSSNTINVRGIGRN